MATLTLICALFIGVSMGAPQFNGDPSMAKIIQEQRFNVGDGRFGHAAQQEDGVLIKEESSGNNERIGEYSYIGDDGKTYTVRYSAGVNGFRILNGDHIPSGGQTSASNVAVEGEEPEEYDYEYYDETKPDSPFVNPHDPTHQSPELLAGNLAGHLAGIFRAQGGATTTTPRPGAPTTTPRLRVFPRGQVELDRTPEGFNFRFQSE